MRCSLTAFGLVLAGMPAFAQELPESTVAAIEAEIAVEMAAKDLPGLVAGIWIPGEGNHIVARGLANLETGAPRGLEDPFRVGSVTKTFIATARLQAAPLEGAPDFVRYGQGLALIGPFCGHDGTIMGSSTEAWYLPSRDAVMVINVSRLDADDKSMSSELFFKLAKLLFPQDVPW